LPRLLKKSYIYKKAEKKFQQRKSWEEVVCKIFSELNPDHYAYQTRSVRLGAHATSVRLEAAFWAVLDEIAAEQGMTLGRFLTKLHDEVLEFRGEAHNFSSLLRCACLTYIGDIKRSSASMAIFAGETKRNGDDRAPSLELRAD
jgi:predicted DNA-binding ribbon-helix-helix protein